LNLTGSGTLQLDNSTSLNDAIVLSLVSGTTLNLNFTGSETISSLVLNGTSIGGGTYDVTQLQGLSEGAGITFTGSGSLTVAVPEPSVVALLALGLGGWLFRIRGNARRASADRA
jgi:hypothetical protein